MVSPAAFIDFLSMRLPPQDASTGSRVQRFFRLGETIRRTRRVGIVLKYFNKRMTNRIPKHAPDPTDKFVGSQVRSRRIGLQLSQTKLGGAVGVTFQQIQKHENGRNRISASDLFKIASTLNVNVGYF
jgi:DNA-binding XRE family transcriptional regulator